MSPIDQHTLQYGDDPRQLVQIYHCKNSVISTAIKHSETPADSTSANTHGDERKSVLVFIHGGAWRDARNTYRDADILMTNLVGDKFTHGASIDYRLSPEHKHPVHIKDVCAGLTALFRSYEFDRWVLAGHSAGAFLALQAILRNTEFSRPDALVLVDGIYDLRSLILEYPSYRGFVEEAFGTDGTEWDTASPASGKYCLVTDEKKAETVNWKLNTQIRLYNGKVIFAHSDEDELLSWKQTDQAVDRLLKRTTISPQYKICKLTGKHEEVYGSKGLVDVIIRYAIE